MKQRPDHRRWLPLILVCLGLLVGARPAVAAAGGEPSPTTARPPRILLIADPAGARVAAMLRSELMALGMDVVQPDQPVDEDLPRDLIAAARRSNTVAVLRVRLGGAAIEVWIADRATGQQVLREALPQGAGSAVDDSVIVLRAIELLRASLAADAPRPARVEAAPAIRSQPAPDQRADSERYSLTLQAAGFFSPGGAGGSAGVLAAVGWRASRWLGVRLMGGATLTAAELDAAAGSVAIQSRWLGAELAVATPPAPTRWRHRAGIGGALIATSLRGRVAASSSGQYVAGQDTLLSPALTISAGTSYRLSRNLRLAASVWAAIPWRSPTIVIAGQDAGSYGALIAAAAVGLEMAWPGWP